MPRFSRGFDSDAAHLDRRDRRLGAWTPRALAEIGERWGPYRTSASLYLWRIADAATRARATTPRSQD